jgi:hypothetical protein
MLGFFPARPARRAPLQRPAPQRWPRDSTTMSMNGQRLAFDSQASVCAGQTVSFSCVPAPTSTLLAFLLLARRESHSSRAGRRPLQKKKEEEEISSPSQTEPALVFTKENKVVSRVRRADDGVGHSKQKRREAKDSPRSDQARLPNEVKKRKEFSLKKELKRKGKERKKHRHREPNKDQRTLRASRLFFCQPSASFGNRWVGPERFFFSV